MELAFAKPTMPLAAIPVADASNSDVPVPVAAVVTATSVVPEVPAENTLSRKRRREAENKHDDDPERASRTIFIGNVPLTTTSKQITKLVNEFIATSATGKVESVRFRSIPIKGTAISPGADFRVMLKAAHIKGEYSDSRDTMNAYVVMTTEEAAQQALGLNGHLFGEKHLRVDGAAGTKYDHKRTLFVGNLRFDATEEQVRTFIAGGVAGGDAAVEAVRIVRDRITSVGKGIAFVLLTDRTHVAEALGLSGQRVGGRPVRITRCTEGATKGAAGSAPPAHMGLVGRNKKQGRDGLPAVAGAAGGSRPPGFVKKPRHVPRVPKDAATVAAEGTPSSSAAKSPTSSTVAAGRVRPPGFVKKPRHVPRVPKDVAATAMEDAAPVKSDSKNTGEARSRSAGGSSSSSAPSQPYKPADKKIVPAARTAAITALPSASPPILPFHTPRAASGKDGKPRAAVVSGNEKAKSKQHGEASASHRAAASADSSSAAASVSESATLASGGKKRKRPSAASKAAGPASTTA